MVSKLLLMGCLVAMVVGVAQAEELGLPKPPVPKVPQKKVINKTAIDASRPRLLEPVHVVCIPTPGDKDNAVVCHILMQSRYSDSGDNDRTCEVHMDACRSGYQNFLGRGEACVGLIECWDNHEIVSSDPPELPKLKK